MTSRSPDKAGVCPGRSAACAPGVLQVHKFSKFIHGTATLLPDMVQAVPYWVDDESLRPSINSSAPQPAHAVAV